MHAPSNTIPASLVLASLVLAALAAACNVHGVTPFAWEISAEHATTWEIEETRKVDILWVIDNSNSMCEEQTALRDNFEAFADELAATDLDFNLAVVTTDMLDATQAGRFQNTPRGETNARCTTPPDISACPGADDPAPLVIRSTDPRYLDASGALDVDTLRRDFGCNATVGVDGFGFEMGLEAARRALSPDLLQTHNSGFLRDDAHLAVVFVTDENDCSNPGSIETTNGDVCEWDRDRLTPVSEYVGFFQSVKPDPAQVIIAGVIAPDSGLRAAEGEPVIASCDTAFGEGYSGYRYEEVIRAFPQRAVANLCQPEQFDRTLQALGSLIRESTERRCLSAPPQTCTSDAECGAGACASRGDALRFCEGFVLQVEVLRPEGASQDGLDCEPTADGRERCILKEGLHHTINWNDDACAATGISVSLNIALDPGDALIVRYPRQIQ